MKSLEIVNEMLNYPFEERILTELATNETIIREEELRQIKQDLEVLEIIRKKYVDVDVVRICLKKYEDIDTALWYYNFLALREYRILTLEELLKVKQWLEENENDN